MSTEHIDIDDLEIHGGERMQWSVVAPDLHVVLQIDKTSFNNPSDGFQNIIIQQTFYGD